MLCVIGSVYPDNRSTKTKHGLHSQTNAVLPVPNWSHYSMCVSIICLFTLFLLSTLSFTSSSPKDNRNRTVRDASLIWSTNNAFGVSCMFPGVMSERVCAPSTYYMHPVHDYSTTLLLRVNAPEMRMLRALCGDGVALCYADAFRVVPSQHVLRVVLMRGCSLRCHAKRPGVACIN